MESSIITLRKVEVIEKENMEEEVIFLEEEEELEEVKLDVMLVERQGTCIGNAQRGRNTQKEEKNIFFKQRSMLKQK
jgi:hypothetical protein